MAFTRDWNENFPPDTQAANLLGQDIRDFKTDIRERVASLSGPIADRPAEIDMITGWGAYGGNGMLYFATDTGAIYQWNGSAWVAVSFSGLNNLVFSADEVTFVGGPTTVGTGSISGGVLGIRNGIQGAFIAGLTGSGISSIQLVYGGSAVTLFGVGGLSNGITVQCYFTMFNEGVTNGQRITGFMNLSDDEVPNTGGLFMPTRQAVATGQASVDSTADQTLTLQGTTTGGASVTFLNSYASLLR